MMGHGFCYLWNTQLIILMAGSDAFIAFAYFLIPCVLFWATRRSNGALPEQFRLAVLSFSLFIFFCGVGHVIDIWTIWFPWYWLKGIWNAGTAVASLATAFLMVPLTIRFVKWMKLAEAL